jgi:UPF0755 protein
VAAENSTPAEDPVEDVSEESATAEETPAEEADTEQIQGSEQAPIIVPMPETATEEAPSTESAHTDEPEASATENTHTKETQQAESVDDPLPEPLAEESKSGDTNEELSAEESALPQAENSEPEQTPEETVCEQSPELSVAEATEPLQNTPTPVIPSEEGKTMSDEEHIQQPEEEPAEETPEKPAPPKKRRPKNTKAYGFLGIPHLLATAIWLGIILFIGVGLGKFVWNCAADVLALGKPDSEVIITITEEDDLESLAEKLKATGLINYPSLFKIYGEISEAMDTIRTGTFKLNTQFDYHALVDAMSSNQRRETTNVTIPEGYTCAQIFRLLENKGVCTIEKLEAAAVNADLDDYWFLEGVERGSANCLEGFMFPDTYTFYLDHDPTGVIRKFLDNFNKRFNDRMKIKLDTLNMTVSEMMRKNGLSEDYIAAHQLTVQDVVIIASMIERETASNPESYNISSVIYNRLTNPDQFPYLQIDATLVYYTGRNEITAEDLVTDHPYNTYTRPGLIPGAISNPGAYSLDAALDPAESEYYFYALNPSTGTHHFSKTLKEHEDFLASIRKDESEEEPEEEPQE